MGERWEPGDVARCVDDSGNREGWREWIQRGARYTVAGVFPDQQIRRLYPRSNGITLTLLETKHRTNPVGGWSSARFVKEPPLISEEEREASRELTEG